MARIPKGWHQKWLQGLLDEMEIVMRKLDHLSSVAEETIKTLDERERSVDVDGALQRVVDACDGAARVLLDEYDFLNVDPEFTGVPIDEDEKPKMEGTKLRNIIGIGEVELDDPRTWVVHLSRESVTGSRGSRYNESTSLMIKDLRPYLQKVGVDISDGDIGSVGYDDITIFLNNKRQAVDVARKLNTVLPEATSQYKSQYGVSYNAVAYGPVGENGEDWGNGDYVYGYDEEIYND